MNEDNTIPEPSTTHTTGHFPANGGSNFLQQSWMM